MAASMFDEIMASADGPLDEAFSKEVLIRRGGVSGTTTTLRATLQSHDSIADLSRARSSEAGLMESWHGHNWIVRAEDYKFGGTVTEPLAGDELLEPLAGGGYTVFELMPPAGQRVYEPIDAEGRKLMIFAVETGTE